MVQPRPSRDQHGDPFPHPHPEDQPRLVGERHPKEANSLPLGEIWLEVVDRGFLKARGVPSQEGN